MIIFWYVFLGVVGYLCGNFNFARIISKKVIKSDKLEKEGGNPGMMNIYRTYGTKYALLVLTLDMLKAIIPCLIALFIVGQNAVFITGTACILGHIFPIFYKFKGGKGIATAYGVFMVANPIAMSIAFVLVIIFILVFEYGGAGNILAIAGLVSYEAVVFKGQIIPLVCLSVIFVLTWFAHRKNIIKTITGTEKKSSIRKVFFKKYRQKEKITNIDV